MRIGPLFIGWQDIDQADCWAIGLSPMCLWEGFYIEWNGSGWLIGARPKRTPA